MKAQMLENVYEGLNVKNVYEGLNVKNVYEGLNVENVYEGLNARSEVYLSKKYFCKMYPTCMSSKFCEFINFEEKKHPIPWWKVEILDFGHFWISHLELKH